MTVDEVIEQLKRTTLVSVNGIVIAVVLHALESLRDENARLSQAAEPEAKPEPQWPANLVLPAKWVGIAKDENGSWWAYSTKPRYGGCGEWITPHDDDDFESMNVLPKLYDFHWPEVASKESWIDNPACSPSGEVTQP
jgi:hypothetical protein